MAVIPPEGFGFPASYPDPMRKAMDELRDRVMKEQLRMLFPPPESPATRFEPFSGLMRSTEPLISITSLGAAPPDKCLTNFTGDQLETYKTAIAIYEKVYAKDERQHLFIRHDAYSKSGHRLPQYQALHVEFSKNMGADCSPFWRIVDVVRKWKGVTDANIEAAIAYFKWKTLFLKD
ncbi:hypothetical protein D3C87_992930 [compost metagenome]